MSNMILPASTAYQLAERMLKLEYTPTKNNFSFSINGQNTPASSFVPVYAEKLKSTADLVITSRELVDLPEIGSVFLDNNETGQMKIILNKAEWTDEQAL